MAMIAVERGVPMPEPKGRGRPAKYPWRKMGVGDSFRSDPPVGFSKSRYQSHLSAAAAGAAKRMNAKFMTRIDDNGVRVWRVA